MPSRLELSTRLVPPPPGGAEGCEGGGISGGRSDAVERSHSCALDSMVTIAVREGRLRYTEAEDDEESAATLSRCVSVVVRQAHAMMKALVARGSGSRPGGGAGGGGGGGGIEGYLVKRLILGLGGFSVRHA